MDAFLVARNSDLGYFNLLLQVSSYSSENWVIVADCYDIILCQVYLFALLEKRMYFKTSKYFVRLYSIARGALGEVRKNICLSKFWCTVDGYMFVYISYSQIEGMLRVQKIKQWEVSKGQN